MSHESIITNDGGLLADEPLYLLPVPRRNIEFYRQVDEIGRKDTAKAV